MEKRLIESLVTGFVCVFYVAISYLLFCFLFWKFPVIGWWTLRFAIFVFIIGLLLDSNLALNRR